MIYIPPVHAETQRTTCSDTIHRVESIEWNFALSVMFKYQKFKNVEWTYLLFKWNYNWSQWFDYIINKLYIYIFLLVDIILFWVIYLISIWWLQIHFCKNDYFCFLSGEESAKNGDWESHCKRTQGVDWGWWIWHENTLRALAWAEFSCHLICVFYGIQHRVVFQINAIEVVQWVSGYGAEKAVRATPLVCKLHVLVISGHLYFMNSKTCCSQNRNCIVYHILI